MAYEPSKDKKLAKFFSKTEKRYINVVAYQYNEGEPKIRIMPSSKNTNPNCEPKKQWINAKAISGMSKQEVKDLIVALEKAVQYI